MRSAPFVASNQMQLDQPKIWHFLFKNTPLQNYCIEEICCCSHTFRCIKALGELSCPKLVRKTSNVLCKFYLCCAYLRDGGIATDDTRETKIQTLQALQEQTGQALIVFRIRHFLLNKTI